MPFYEMILMCKVGEQQAMGTLVKTVSSFILAQGGVVRNVTNLGDRIISKNLKAEDGQKYGVARYIQLEFDGTPKTVQLATDQAKLNTETLRVYTHRIREQDYVNRTMKRLNQELSPFKDENTKDVAFVRAMWDQYTRKDQFEQATKQKQINKDEHTVHAFLKNMESGPDHPDTKTLVDLAQGNIKKDDEKLKAYFIKQYQKRRL